MKIGMGYDIHRLVEGRPMVLGGVKMDFPKGPEGHSDGDVLLHAVCDAVLGALGKGDIGMRFPDDDPGYKDVPSGELLKDVVTLMEKEGYTVENLDCVIMAEQPKIGPYREEMARAIGGMLKVPGEAVNVKAKTAERMGDIGEGRAVAAYAVVLLDKREG